MSSSTVFEPIPSILSSEVPRLSFPLCFLWWLMPKRWASSRNCSKNKGLVVRGIHHVIAREATYVRASWGQGYRFPSMAILLLKKMHLTMTQ